MRCIARRYGDIHESIAALDKEVADATEQRKEEHAAYVEGMQMNEVAKGLVEKAKNRMQKFYNPTLYKAPPKKEMPAPLAGQISGRIEDIFTKAGYTAVPVGE